MNKHTPGPWILESVTVKDQGLEGRTVFQRWVDGNGMPHHEWICRFPKIDAEKTNLERITANATLIAAAPELLQKLKALYSLWSKEYPIPTEENDARFPSDYEEELSIEIELLISKAEGK